MMTESTASGARTAPLLTTGTDRLVLITTGRYSGRSEATLLTYRRYQNSFLVLASNQRNRSKPDWYLNIREEPLVQIELGDASCYAQAHTPTGLERVRMLPLVAEFLNGIDNSIPRETAAILLTPMN
ncbi:MAG: nitroreductase/quinone reductase family protein [Pseudomonadota bacterium]